MAPELFLVLGFVAGTFVGGLIGWLLAARRPVPADARLEEELRRQLAHRTEEASSLREELDGRRASLAAAEANRDAAQKLLAEQRMLHEEQMRELRAAQERALSDLREAFRAMSASALKETQPEFLRLANETFAKFHETAKGDLVQRQQTIATLLKPLEEQLKIYQQRLAQSDTSQSTALGEVRKHLEALTQHSQSLSNETLQLRRVLSSNQARGRWGEETLRRVVEAAGMSPHCDFTEQIQSGDSKPDLIVHLPGQRAVLVDAKVPDFEMLSGLDSADPANRAEALSAYAARLRATIKELGERDYPREFPHALDHVVLFVPTESLFSAALEGDPDILVWAARRQVLIATPASLIALLRSVSVSWQQHDQTENARAIAEAAQELFSRVCRFTEHLERIGSGLERATAAFNDAIGSYERMVRPSGEKLLKLGAGVTGREFAVIEPLNPELRLRPANSGQ